MQILALRKMRGLSQMDVAKEIGVDQTTVHLWETGKTKPRVETLMKLASYFNVTVDELLSADE